MDGGTTDRWTRQSEMKNRQIKQTEVDGSIDKKYYRTSPPGGSAPRNLPLPSALRITLQWDGLHVHDEHDLSS